MTSFGDGCTPTARARHALVLSSDNLALVDPSSLETAAKIGVRRTRIAKSEPEEQHGIVTL